jgi:type VI secretion system protein VasD
MIARWMARLAALTLAALVAACAAPPAPPPPTSVALTIATTPDMNNSAPARVQVYYLASSAGFQGQDYFALSGDPQVALGADLVATDEYLLNPGGGAADQKTFDRPVTHVGVVVGFRDIGTAAWRGTLPLTANAANPVKVTVTANAVTVGAGQ